MSKTESITKQLANITVPIEDTATGGPASPFTDLGQFITTLFLFALIITAIFSFIYLVVGGFSYITSGGDKAAAQTARDRITYSLLGLAVVAGAAAFFSILGAVFGINIFTQINWPGPT